MRPVFISAFLTLMAAGCGATMEQLNRRAEFDTGCRREEMEVIKLDERSVGVICRGKRLTYVESCQRVNPDGSKQGCTWVIDK